MDLNKKFRTYVIESDKVVDLVVHLLCYCLDAKDKPGSCFFKCLVSIW